MKLNKNIIIAILLLSVFAVGTIGFTDTVEGAKWKKFDSGSFTPESSTFTVDSSFKQNKVLFVSYIKGSDKLKIKYYAYKKNNNKKVLESTDFLTKTGKKIKITSVDYKGKKLPYSGTLTFNYNLKKDYYKAYISPF